MKTDWQTVRVTHRQTKKSIQGSIMLMTVKAIDSESLLLFTLFPTGDTVYILSGRKACEIFC